MEKGQSGLENGPLTYPVLPFPARRHSQLGMRPSQKQQPEYYGYQQQQTSGWFRRRQTGRVLCHQIGRVLRHQIGRSSNFSVPNRPTKLKLFGLIAAYCSTKIPYWL